MATITKTISPKELAAELNIDPKRLRAYLRKEYARKPEEKNTSWRIPESTANAARKFFTPKEEKVEEKPKATKTVKA
jgi:hypothetical protein